MFKTYFYEIYFCETNLYPDIFFTLNKFNVDTKKTSFPL